MIEMRKKLIKNTFVIFVIGTIFSMITLLFFFLFNQNLPSVGDIVIKGAKYYSTTPFSINNFYTPGFVLSIISLIINIIGIIFFGFGLFLRKRVNENSRGKYFFISSFIVYCFAIGLLIEVVINLVILKIHNFSNSATTIQNYYYFGFNLFIFYIICILTGIILFLLGFFGKNIPKIDQNQLSTGKFSFRNNKLEFPFFLILIAIVFSFITFIYYIDFNTGIVKAFISNQLEDRIKLPVSYINREFLPGFFIITISLILFIIGIVILILRVKNQIYEDNKNFERNRLLIISVILLFFGFALYIATYLRFLIFNVFFEGPTDSYLPLGLGYLIYPAGIYNYYFQGFIILFISMIFSVMGIVFLMNEIISKSRVVEKSQKESKIVSKEKNNIKISFMLISIATTLLGCVFVLFIIYDVYTINSLPGNLFCECNDPTGIFMPLSGMFYYYFPGFVLYTISLILIIAAMVEIVIGLKKLEENFDFKIQDEAYLKKINMRGSILRQIFIIIGIGFIISLIAYSKIIIFNAFLSGINPFPYFFISYSNLQDDYYPGFFLVTIILIVNVIAMVSLVLNRKLFEKQESGK